MPHSREASAGTVASFDDIYAPDGEVDSQLRSNMEDQMVRQLYDHWAPILRSQCETANHAVASAWETIQSEMASFRRQKTTLFSSLRNMAGPRGAARIISMGLDKIEPSAYQNIARKPEAVFRPTVANVSTLTMPRQDDSELFVPQTSGIASRSTPVTGSTRPCPVPSTLRSQGAAKPAPATPSPSKAVSVKPTLSVRNRPIDSGASIAKLRNTDETIRGSELDARQPGEEAEGRSVDLGLVARKGPSNKPGLITLGSQGCGLHLHRAQLRPRLFCPPLQPRARH